MGPVFGLSADEGFQLIRESADNNGVTHYRYQQTYNGIPVWGMQTVVSKGRDNQVFRIHGNMVQGNPNDIGAIPAGLDAPGALNRMKTLHAEKDSGAAWNFRNEKYGTYVYFDNGKSRLCYVVSFFSFM